MAFSMVPPYMPLWEGSSVASCQPAFESSQRKAPMLAILEPISSFLQSIMALAEGCVPISIAMLLWYRDLGPEPC